MSSSAATAAFEAHAPEYTALRRRLVANYDLFYGSVPDALAFPGVRELRCVLDLGAGTGLLTAHVADRFPDARFELLDGSAAMLAEARVELGARVADVYVQDLADQLPEGPYDAVISALAIHHLEDADKRSLYRQVFARLAPGGAFVNAEQVTGPTPASDAVYLEHWRRSAAAQGATDDQIAAAACRRELDRCADVGSQLDWLSEAGFNYVDCPYKHWGFATLVGIKEGMS